MAEDEDFSSIVRWSFPDEAYESFEDWLAAQHSDDTDQSVSHLWHGGGQWTLYGLALLLRVQILVHTLDAATLEFEAGTEHGTELIDARPIEGGGSVVRLASLRAHDGQFTHFDVLCAAGEAGPGAEPLAHRRALLLESAPRTFHMIESTPTAPKGARLFGWAALNVLALAWVLSLPPAAAGSNAHNVWLRLALSAKQAAQSLFAEALIGGSGDDYEMSLVQGATSALGAQLDGPYDTTGLLTAMPQGWEVSVAG